MSAKCQKRTSELTAMDIVECERLLSSAHQNVVRIRRLNAEAWSSSVVNAGWMTDW